MRTEPEQAWETIAARQHGVLSRTQATACGLSARQVRGLQSRGEWVRVYPSVYRAAAAPVRWPQPLMAAYLWADGKAVVSHRSAAALWDLDGFFKSHLELSGLAALKPPSGVRFHRVGVLGRADVEARQGMRVTSMARTLLDLVSAVPPRTVERALDEALRRGLVTVPQVQGCIERNGRRGREGVGRLTALLEERTDQRPNDSPHETEVAAVLREHGLPTPVRNHRIVERGKFIAQVDLAWPALKVAVQAHSSYHRQLPTWEQDQDTENKLQTSGWTVVKATPRAVRERPGDLVAQVRDALALHSPPRRARA